MASQLAIDSALHALRTEPQRKTHNTGELMDQLESFIDEGNVAVPSSTVIVPLVKEWLSPKSVIDIGCAYGIWLKAFRDQGCERILGVDADWVDRNKLVIPPECFLARDLAATDLWLTFDQRFDLAVCLETAEHVPLRNANLLVACLVSAAPAVLFSAAPPGQMGHRHINCQPLYWWRELFALYDFRMRDPLRPLIREDQRIGWWYRQNMVLFADSRYINAKPALPEIPVGRECEWVRYEVFNEFFHPKSAPRAFVSEVWRRIHRRMFPQVKEAARRRAVGAKREY